MHTNENNLVCRVSVNGRPAQAFCARDGVTEYLADGRTVGVQKDFSVFPGVRLIYRDFFCEADGSDFSDRGDLLEINYCREGRAEYAFETGGRMYLGPSDFTVHRIGKPRAGFTLSACRYKGITVVLEPKTLKASPPPLLDSSAFDFDALTEKFCGGRDFFAMRANEKTEHIFSELYEIPEEVRDDYFKIKVLELLIFLRLIDAEKEALLGRATESQIEVIKAVKKRLCRDFSENLTIEQLSKEFCISPTALKTNFKAVYGCTVKAFLRRERMEKAAALLRTGNDPVLSVALRVGYANQSKFAAAFKKAYNLPPSEYRKKCAADAGKA